jgi:hypothetical protein
VVEHYLLLWFNRNYQKQDLFNTGCSTGASNLIQKNYCIQSDLGENIEKYDKKIRIWEPGLGEKWHKYCIMPS